MLPALGSRASPGLAGFGIEVAGSRIADVLAGPLVRVFPAASGSSFGSHTNRWMPPWWVLDDRLEPVPVFERLDVADAVLTLRGSGGTVTADPSNLELR